MTAFEPAVGRWLAGLDTPRNLVRQELVARQLAAHLPARPALRVLDVGCGQGTQAIRLAALGHQVTGVDTSPELLDRAREDARAAPSAGSIRFERADLFQLAGRRPGAWDVVCCHGVVMYLPSLDDALAALVALTAAGGVLSVLTRNRAGIAMRAGMARRWSEAVAGFDATHYTNGLGISGVRADDPEAVRAGLTAAGAELVAWYGVRLFSDPLPADATLDEAELAELIAAELEAGRRDPYRQVAALTHTIARRKPAAPG